jgi:hypothetical protein
MTSTCSVFEVIFFFLAQLECDIIMPKIGCGPLPMDVAASQIPEVPSGHASPDCREGHLSRIADLEDRLSSLKHQTSAAMEQDTKSSGLMKKVSSLEEQMSILVAKITQLEEWDLYMTEIIESTCEELQCKLLGAPECYLFLFLVRYLTFVSQVSAWTLLMKIVE